MTNAESPIKILKTDGNKVTVETSNGDEVTINTIQGKQWNDKAEQKENSQE